MADNAHTNPDSEAKKWFMLAVIGTVLYVAAAFTFVILADPGPHGIAVEAGDHGQHD